MPEKKTGIPIVAPVICMIGVAIAAVAGIPSLMLALLVLPVAAAMLSVTAGWPGVAAVCAAAGIACGMKLPGAALPAALFYCVGSALPAVLPLKKAIHRPILWGGLCLGLWVVGLATLLQLTGGQIVNGIAQAAVDWIEHTPERDSILLQAYSMGLSRINVTWGLNLSYSLTGQIPESVRLQMLYSLRVSLEEALPSLICDALVYHTAITVLLCTVLPDGMRRRRGETGELPAMDQWYIPRKLGVAVFALCIGWLIALMAQEGVMAYLGWLCTDVFKAAFMLQGICWMMWMGKRMGIRTLGRNLWALALSVLVPLIPIIMGMIDQRRDARHLRPDKEVEQG